MTTTAQLYRRMIGDSMARHCWACGREPSDTPPGWYGPFGLDRAHIVSKPRIEDVRAVVLLCSLCHRVSRGERIIMADGQPCPFSPLRVAHLLWLKLVRDPQNYDRAFLKRFCLGRLPNAHRPPLCYRLEYLKRHGE